MLQKSLLLSIFLFTLGSSAKAKDPVDAFIRDHCTHACNGESDECRMCYNEAVDLFDQNAPTSPEINWDLHYDQGKLKLEF